MNGKQKENLAKKKWLQEFLLNVRCNRVNQTDKQTNKQKFLVEEIRREEGRATYEANDDCSEDQFCQLLQI